MRFRALAAALGCGAAAIAAVYAAPPRSFRFERQVQPAGVGGQRLDPDVELLRGAVPLRYFVHHEEGTARRLEMLGGLEDLRLFAGSGADGAEVPYLLIAPPSTRPVWRSARMLAVAPTKKTSGFEMDLGSALDVDRVRFEGIAAPFLKRLWLEGSGDRARWTALVSEATVFDLPEQRLRHLEVAFVPGSYRYLRVTWDDRASARVHDVAVAQARLHAPGSQPQPVRVPVSFKRRTSEPGRSRYRLQLPGGGLPVVAIELAIAGGDVFRDAAVFEPRLGDSEVVPVRLGSERLRRARLEDGVAAELAVPVEMPRGPDLELVVEDGDNPPLELTGIVAHLAPLPWIYFESAAGAAITARWGNATLAAPRYDIEASRRRLEAGVVLPQAQWSGGAAPPPGIEESDGAIAITGARLDRSSFTVKRPIPAAPPGLTLLLLDADVLARSRALADVRIADGAGNQVPYLTEARGEPVIVPLAVPAREADAEERASRYRFALPYDTLPTGTRLVVTTKARIFDRPVRLIRPADERGVREAQTLASERWLHAVPETQPPALTFTASLAGTKAVELVVEEGDNAPLALATARLELPSRALRFQNPGGALDLLYGNATAEAPRYDIALLAPRLLGESAHEIDIAAGPKPTPPPGPSGRERYIFWIAIGVAVVVLLMLLARLLAAPPPAASE